MKFSVALSFIAATALTSSVSGSPIKRDQANAETLKGASACNAAQSSQPLPTVVPNAAVAADLVIETVIVTVTAGSGDGSASVVTSAVEEDTAEPTAASGDDSGAPTPASDDAIPADSGAAASGDDSGAQTAASDDAIPADSDAAAAADTDAAGSAPQEGSATSVVTDAATDATAAASPSLSAGSGAQDAISSSSAPTAATTEQQQQADTPASSSASGDGGSSSGGGDSQTFTGDGTYYSPGLGACGITNTDSDLIAAINAEQYGSSSSGNSNSASVCGKCVQVKGPNGQVKVKITDKCPSCKSGDLDLSPAAFDQIGSEAAGRISISWSFVDC
ncbi:hypothetical protein LPJ59_001640 [Coemansia sp. RSA 2399]|nr:hypothetical protein LPJ59_001640 [Coemansia sp. RSA 2399]KAJ1905168.1 hypothetical protein LPJ81_002071 [Coemansia sp. IMI 209127]